MEKRALRNFFLPGYNFFLQGTIPLVSSLSGHNRTAERLSQGTTTADVPLGRRGAPSTRALRGGARSIARWTCGAFGPEGKQLPTLLGLGPERSMPRWALGPRADCALQAGGWGALQRVVPRCCVR